MKLLEIIKENPKKLNEGVFATFISKAIPGFRATVSSTIEGMLKTALDDIARGSNKVTLATIKNSQSVKNATVQAVAEASITKFKKPFEQLTKSEGEILAKQVQDGIDSHLRAEASRIGKLADADVVVARQAVDQTSDALKAGTAIRQDVIAATKDLAVNQKLAVRLENMKAVLGGKSQMSRTQIINALKKDAVVITDTGANISTKVAGETTIYSGGKLLKISKEQLKAFPGQVKQVIVKRPVLSTLVALGLTAAVLYLIYGEGTILTDEGGNAIDDNGQISEYAACIQDLVNDGKAEIVSSSTGEISVLVLSSIDYPGGIKFYSNGRVFDIAASKMGKFTCKEGQLTIAEQELMPYAYQYSQTPTLFPSVDRSPETQDSSNVETQGSSNFNISDTIQITWDTPKVGGGGGGTTYRDCNSKSLPHEFGCRSEQIKKAQICLGLPQKYQTGNFGPITKKAIEDKGIDTSNGLTQDVLDKVCGSEGTTPLNREPIQPITADRLKMSDLTMPKVDIKLPDIKPLEVSDTVFYNAFRDNGNLVGEDGNNRIKYKGPDLDEVQLGKLDNVILPMGYTRIKNLEELKPYGSKYVWKKIS